MGISCWISHKAVWSPQKIATSFRDRALTYRDLEGWVAHLAGYLAQEMGVQRGESLAYLGRNSDVIVALFFACARLGVIFVPLNARLTAGQLGVMINNAEPRYLFAGEGFEAVAQDCTAGLDVAVVPLVDCGGAEGTLDLFAGVRAAAPIACNPGLDQELPALIAYTSGTTGAPRGRFIRRTRSPFQRSIRTIAGICAASIMC